MFIRLFSFRRGIIFKKYTRFCFQVGIFLRHRNRSEVKFTLYRQIFNTNWRVSLFLQYWHLLQFNHVCCHFPSSLLVLSCIIPFKSSKRPSISIKIKLFYTSVLLSLRSILFRITRISLRYDII